MRINTLINRLTKNPVPSIINDKKYYEVEELAFLRKKNSSSYIPIVVLGFHEKDLNYFIIFSEKAEEIKGFKKPAVESTKVKLENINLIEEYVSYEPRRR